MLVGIPREITPGERRVAATPDSVTRLRKQGFEVMVEAGAGEAARFFDAAYVAAGARIEPDTRAVWAQADLVLKVRPPTFHPGLESHESELVREGGRLICLLHPAQNTELIERLATRNPTVIALDAIPRITRAQKMDVLSSMANLAGYRAIIEAAASFGGFFGGQITAAGKTAPVQVLIIGAGVAGLAAIGVARGLGAQVKAFDVRPSVKEQVQSMGAQFLEVELQESGEGEGGYARTMSKEFIEAEMALFAREAKVCGVIVTTALIPGKPAPTLITRAMVESMRPGSVIVDMAAEQGGNCECTVPGQAVEVNGVTILGYTDLVSRMAGQASQFFSSNLCHLLDDMGGAELRVDLEDEAVRGALVLHEGRLMWPPPKREAPPAPAPKAAAPQATEPRATVPAPPAPAARPAKHSHGHAAPSGGGPGPAAGLVAAVLLTALGVYAPGEFLQHFTVFVLACFVGWQVIWNVTPALHTPLMSVTNAISGIIIVGGLLQAGSGELNLAAILGAVAIVVASINVAGGFLVTHRMLQMFRK